jgi:NDP-sugar pyrophosphorylase family protein
MNKQDSNHINNTDRPLIFLGSNSVMEKYTELCEELGIVVAGLLDNDYWGNTAELGGVKVLDTEKNIDQYLNNYNFFCATNWNPIDDPIMVRNRQKRQYLIDLVRQKNIQCISLVDPTARISKYSRLGNGCFIDCHVMVESGSIVGDFTNIYGQVQVGHNTTIGENCVLQRAVGLASAQILENDVYLSSGVKALKPGVKISQGTFVHELVYLARGTVSNEVVQFGTNNTKRVERPYNSVLG